MRVLVVCNAGMSSSILVKKMKDYAASQGEALMIKAVCSAAAEDEAGEWDVCLVGPQLMHAVDEIAEAVEVPTEAVDMRTYAMADGEGALKQGKKTKKK